MKYLVLLLILPILNLNALTNDLEIDIASNSSLTMEYIIAKGVCKMLNRQLELSKFMGGTNKLDCNVIISKGTKSNLDLIKLGEADYAVINICEINSNNDLSNFQAVVYFKGINSDWLFITSKKSNAQKICEVTEALFNNYLEFSYLHSDFKNFSKESFTTKKFPFHIGAFKYFDKKNCKIIKDTISDF